MQPWEDCICLHKKILHSWEMRPKPFRTWVIKEKHPHPPQEVCVRQRSIQQRDIKTARIYSEETH